VFDSSVVIPRDARIRAVTPENLRLILTGTYSGTNAGLYRPLTTFSYLVNYAVFGNADRAAGYHWVNVTLHAANVSLVYLLGLLIFGASGRALAMAALWAAHPLLTESVTNIVGRADLLAAFGVLAGLLCYLRSISTNGRARVAWLAGVMAAQAVGLFSKENAAILPGLMLLYDLTWRDRARQRKPWMAYAALAPAFAVFCVARIALQLHMRVSNTDNPLVSVGFWTGRLTAVKVIGKYLWLFVWPAHLSPDYSYRAVPSFGWNPLQWEDAKALIALAVCAIGAWVAIRCYRGRKPLFFFLGFFFVALLPASNLVVLIGSIMAERFVYLPSIGLAGGSIAALYEVSRRVSARKRVLAWTGWIALGLACLACAARTYARNFDWLDEASLWTSAVLASPESAKAHYNLGTVLAGVPGQLPQAIAAFEAALRIDPDDAEAHDNLGKALSAVPERLPEAIAQFRAAVRIDPGLAAAHSNLGAALEQLPGQLPDAIGELETALRLDPDLAEAHSNLGKALAQLPGRLPDAIAQFEAALRIDPNIAMLHANLGAALYQTPGRLPDAIGEFQTALRIDPDLALVHNNLGIALAQSGRLPDAVAEFQAALRIDPGNAQAHANLEKALSQLRGGEAGPAPDR